MKKDQNISSIPISPVMFHLRMTNRTGSANNIPERYIPDNRPLSPQTGANVNGLRNGALDSEYREYSDSSSPGLS